MGTCHQCCSSDLQANVLPSEDLIISILKALNTYELSYFQLIIRLKRISNNEVVRVTNFMNFIKLYLAADPQVMLIQQCIFLDYFTQAKISELNIHEVVLILLPFINNKENKAKILQDIIAYFNSAKFNKPLREIISFYYYFHLIFVTKSVGMTISRNKYLSGKYSSELSEIKINLSLVFNHTNVNNEINVLLINNSKIVQKNSCLLRVIDDKTQEEEDNDGDDGNGSDKGGDACEGVDGFNNDDSDCSDDEGRYINEETKGNSKKSKRQNSNNGNDGNNSNNCKKTQLRELKSSRSLNTVNEEIYSEKFDKEKGDYTNKLKELNKAVKESTSKKDVKAKTAKFSNLMLNNKYNTSNTNNNSHFTLVNKTNIIKSRTFKEKDGFYLKNSLTDIKPSNTSNTSNIRESYSKQGEESNDRLLNNDNRLGIVVDEQRIMNSSLGLNLYIKEIQKECDLNEQYNVEGIIAEIVDIFKLRNDFLRLYYKNN